jgi:hypothetical protein
MGKMKKILSGIAVLVLICCSGYARETLDLFPDQPGLLICWTEIETAPRPIRIYFLKVALDTEALEVMAMPGDDPDGAGPAESELTPPEDLFRKFQAIAAVNANAFAGLEAEAGEHPDWYEGQPVDVHGLLASRGTTVSPVEDGRTPFWLDGARRPHIGNPAAGDSVKEAVSDWFSPLLLESRIVADPSDRALHPRTALGFDDSGSWLILVVVDGRQPGYSEGVTLYELAEILQSHGCSRSINLDGGGSSIMLIREPGKDIRTFNSPSGKAPRPVPVMLGIKKTAR